jgi:hypothetical protein
VVVRDDVITETKITPSRDGIHIRGEIELIRTGERQNAHYNCVAQINNQFSKDGPVEPGNQQEIENAVESSKQHVPCNQNNSGVPGKAFSPETVRPLPKVDPNFRKKIQQKT